MFSKRMFCLLAALALLGSAGTAAAAQMNAGAPVLNTPSTNDDDFVSFYSQNRKNQS